MLFLGLCSILPPVLAALFVFLSRTEYSRDIRSHIPVLAVGFSFLASSTLFYKLLSGPIVQIIDICTWFSIGTFKINISLLIDSLSIIMLFIITSYRF